MGFFSKEPQLTELEIDQLKLDVNNAFCGDEKELKEFQKFVRHLRTYQKLQKLLSVEENGEYTQEFDLITGNIQSEKAILTLGNSGNCTLEKKISL